MHIHPHATVMRSDVVRSFVLGVHDVSRWPVFRDVFVNRCFRRGLVRPCHVRMILRNCGV
jgi:hypothetical protein